MKKIFLTGASSGIGKACYDLLISNYNITAPNRSQFDLNNFDLIESTDLSEYDIIIHCAGINTGTYLGFHNNSHVNQFNQVKINFIAPLLLAKQYTKTRNSGHFIYISSASIHAPKVYNIFNASSKAALKYSIDILRNNFPSFIFSEVCPGKTKTNMLKENYNGTKSDKEVEKEYNTAPFLLAADVASLVKYSIDTQINEIRVTPKLQ
jgi:short-subunit dehydrogenase